MSTAKMPLRHGRENPQLKFREHLDLPDVEGAFLVEDKLKRLRNRVCPNVASGVGRLPERMA